MNRKITGYAAWGGLALLIAIPATEMLLAPAPDAAAGLMQSANMAGLEAEPTDPASLPGPQPRPVQPRLSAGDAPGVTPMGDIPIEVRLVGVIPVVKSGVQIAADAAARPAPVASEAAPRLRVANLVAPVPRPAESRPLERPEEVIGAPDDDELANDPEYQELLRRLEREKTVEAALAEASRPGRRRPLVTFFYRR